MARKRMNKIRTGKNVGDEEKKECKKIRGTKKKQERRRKRE